MDNRRFNPDFHLGGPHSKPGPLMTALAVIAGLGMLALAFFLGLIVLAVVAGLAALASVILAVRRWWRRRKYPDGPGGPGSPGSQQGPTTINGEYTVIGVRKSDGSGQ